MTFPACPEALLSTRPVIIYTMSGTKSSLVCALKSRPGDRPQTLCSTLIWLQASLQPGAGSNQQYAFLKVIPVNLKAVHGG